MPHLISDRPRLLSLFKDADNYASQARWENTQAFLYKVGGLAFVVGSIFFFPALEAYMNVGAWIFFGGSILYLIVSGHDTAEVLRYRSKHPSPTIQDRLELQAALSYLIGTILFLVGSLFFLSWIGQVAAGAWCFIIGSLLFVGGSSINIIQVPEKSKRGNLQLINLTAVTFVSGSILFTVASIPYLWHPATQEEERTLDAFLAAQYLVGSFLFLAGGITNYLRARANQKRLMQSQQS